MANELTEEQQLALWMLGRMRDSEEFLGVIRAKRMAGERDVLDTPDYVKKHGERLKPLYQGARREAVDMDTETVAMMEAVSQRDVLSCHEELIEKAIAAYVKLHPKGEEDLPPGWRSTAALAEAHIKGEVKGAFSDGFTAELAGMARAEKARAAEADKSKLKGRTRD